MKRVLMAAAVVLLAACQAAADGPRGEGEREGHPAKRAADDRERALVRKMAANEPEPEPAPRSQQRGCCSVWNDGACLREIVCAEGSDVEVEALRVWRSCWYTTPGIRRHYPLGDFPNFVWRPEHHHVLIFRGPDGGCRYHVGPGFSFGFMLEGVPCPDRYLLPWRRRKAGR